jgi:hypothetical protein
MGNKNEDTQPNLCRKTRFGERPSFAKASEDKEKLQLLFLMNPYDLSSGLVRSWEVF